MYNVWAEKTNIKLLDLKSLRWIYILNYILLYQSLEHAKNTIPHFILHVKQENNDTINYSNMIKFRSSGSIIKRKKDIHLHISCKMLQKTWIQLMYVAEDTVDVHENQFGRYDVNITFYDSSSFLHQVHDFPYYIDLNQNLYLQVYLHSSDPNLVVFVEACMASPDPHDFSTLTYNILENG